MDSDVLTGLTARLAAARRSADLPAGLTEQMVDRILADQVTDRIVGQLFGIGLTLENAIKVCSDETVRSLLETAVETADELIRELRLLLVPENEP